MRSETVDASAGVRRAVDAALSDVDRMTAESPYGAVHARDTLAPTARPILRDEATSRITAISMTRCASSPTIALVTTDLA